MIEVHQTYDLLPNIDQQAYTAWAKKVIGIFLQQPGLIEFRAYRNWVGNPQVLVVMVWETAADWGKFYDSSDGKALIEENYAFEANIHYTVWAPSPGLPQPVRPAK